MSSLAYRELLGISLPIIQAPMAGVQDSKLCIAVSNAGGLGSLPGAMLAPDALRSELSAIRAGTAAPYNVNFFCHAMPETDPQRESAWRAVLQPYFDEYGLSPPGPGAPLRVPFDAQAAEVLEEFRPAVVSFHFGLPSEPMLKRIRSWGSKVLGCATTVEEACWLESRGVDAVIAQGIEAGGHRGLFLTEDLNSQLGTFALLPQVAEAVRVPVIAAGGIASSAGVAAALQLGAIAVQAGTAYLLCAEATTGAAHRHALKQPGVVTALTNLFSGRPARGIVNRLMRDLGPINSVAPAFPLAAGALTPLRAHAERLGCGDFSPLWCGQNASGCREIGAAEMTRWLAGQDSAAGGQAASGQAASGQ
jgi:nitronate monooxygenase